MMPAPLVPPTTKPQNTEATPSPPSVSVSPCRRERRRSGTESASMLPITIMAPRPVSRV